MFRGMPLKQPFKGIVLSPNGTVSVSPADRPILQEMASQTSNRTVNEDLLSYSFVISYRV